MQGQASRARRTVTTSSSAWPDPLGRGADNTGTALLLELPDRAAMGRFWNEEPFANGGYVCDARIARWALGD
jgi:hypothetical protein